jgi:hypothetical protein
MSSYSQSHHTAATALSAATLARQNADLSVVEQQWAIEENERIRRLQTAARELGIDMPAQWCRRY